MPVPIQIILSQTGGPAVQTALGAISAGAKDIAKQFDADAKEAQKLANSLAKIKEGASSTWSPLIAKAQEHAKAMREQAQAAKMVEQALKDEEKAAKELNSELVKVGAASHWSPAISGAKQAEKAIAEANRPTVMLGRSLNELKQKGLEMGRGIRSGALTGSAAIATLKSSVDSLNSGWNQYQDNRGKMSGADAAFGSAQQVGGATMLVGGGALALAGKTGLDAGEYNKIRDAYRRALGETEGDRFLEQVQSSDYAKVFGMKEALRGAQGMITTGGLTPQDIINAQGTGYFQTVGAMAAAGGGKAEGVQEAMRQITQVKRKGKAEKNDLDVIAESGGIDIYGLISARFGQQRTAEVLKGEKPLTYDELQKALQGVPQYKGGQFANAMGDVAGSLPGQIEALRGELFLLSSDIGQYVEPALSFLVGTVRGGIGVFRAIPGPIKTVLVYGALFSAIMLTLGGGLLFTAGMAGQAVIGLMALTGAETAAGIAGTTAGVAISTSLIPALLMTGAAIGLVAIAAYALYMAAVNSDKAAKMSEANWRNQTGYFVTVSRFWGDVIDWIGDKISYVRGLLHLGGQHQFDAENKQALYDAYKTKTEKRGEKSKSFEEWSSEFDQNSARFGGGKNGGDSADKAPEAPAMPKPSEMPNFAAYQAQAQAQMTATQGGAAGASQSAPDPVFPVVTTINNTTNSTANTTNSTTNNSITNAAYNTANTANNTTNNTATNAPAPITLAPAITMPTATGGSPQGSPQAYQEALWAAKDSGAEKGTLEQLRRAKTRAGWAESQRSKNQREAEKSAMTQRIQTGVQALGDGSSDVANLPQLRDQLAAAQRAGDKAQAAILRERIRRATGAAALVRQHDAAERKEEADARTAANLQHTQYMRDLRRQLGAQVRAKAITREAAQARLDAEQTAYENRRSGAQAETRFAGPEILPRDKNAARRADGNEARWMGYTRMMVAQMTRAEALKHINRSGALFEKEGGFKGEAEMAAWQRAFTEKYGETKFAGPEILPRDKNAARPVVGALPDYFRRGGSAFDKRSMEAAQASVAGAEALYSGNGTQTALVAAQSAATGVNQAGQGGAQLVGPAGLGGPVKLGANVTETDEEFLFTFDPVRVKRSQSQRSKPVTTRDIRGAGR
jgi:hypothetical protein